MNVNKFLDEYFAEFHKVVEPADINTQLTLLRESMLRVQKNDKKIILAGNGASASMASHFALDFTKQGKVTAIAFNDASFVDSTPLGLL